MKKFRFFSILTLVGLMLIITSSSIEAASVDFADTNLQSCVNNTLTSQGISVDNATALRRLDCSSKNISNLDGIEQLVNLEYLYLNNNNLVAIDQLESLENLMYLQLYSNDIDSVNALSNLTNLRQLLIDDNNISSISSLNTLDNLMILSANDNEIKDIDSLGNMNNLRELNLVNNSIKNISSIENLTKLEKVRLENNNISNIKPLTNLTGLKLAYLSNNQISSISSLSELTEINELFVDNNQLSDLSGIENMVNLTSVRANGNQISKLPDLSRLVKVKNVHLSGNNISDISPLAKLPIVTSIYINENAISDLSSLKETSSLKIISARDQYVHLENIGVDDYAPIEYSVTDINGTKHPVYLKVVKSGKDTIESSWKANQSNSYFSGSVAQQVNYKPQSQLSGKSKANIYENSKHSDAALINLFNMKNSREHNIVVDQSAVDYKVPGEYSVVFSDSDLNVVTSKLVVEDAHPKITVDTNAIDIMLGQTINNYANAYGAVATETTSGDLQEQLKVDDSNVDYSRVGTYRVKFYVSDKQGNSSASNVDLTISRRKFTITNQDGARMFLYKTSQYGVGLPNYEYTIFDKDGNVVDVIVTDKDGAASTGVLPPGDYYIEQTGAPNGEPIASDRLSVTETISIVNVGDSNSNSIGNGNSNINVNLNGNSTGQIGVYLTGEDGTLVDYGVSDEDGNINFDNVANGTYRLVLDNISNASKEFADAQSITVTEDSENQQFDITVNNKGINLILISAIVLILCIAIAAIRYFIKK